MMSKTHIAVGVAASLAILQPATLGGCLACVIGGSVGGDICDIDVKPSDCVRDALYGHAIVSTIVSVALLADYLLGAGICAAFAAHVGPEMALGLLVLILAGIWGYRSKHRTFTHSLLGLVAMSGALWLVCPVLAPPFAIGFAAHVLLDLLNHKKVQLLYPFKILCFSLGLCRADGPANTLLMCAGTLAALGLFAWRLALCLPAWLAPAL